MNETKDFQLEEGKEKVTIIYDKTFELVEALNLQIKDRDEKTKTLNILHKLIDNALRNKNEEKYRTLKCNNKVLKEYIFCHKPIVKYLEFIGFSPIEIDKEQTFTLIELDETVLQISLSTLTLFSQEANGMNSFTKRDK